MRPGNSRSARGHGKEKLSAAIVMVSREEMKAISRRAGIVLDTLLNYRRLSWAECWIE